MKGGIMNSQQVRAMSGYMPPALPFAQLPNPDSVVGQVYIASDVGPAPGIELISNGTIWRPRGGRQVLAQRSINPVTVQDLAGAVAETIGPFPGGLVRAGMQVQTKLAFQNGAIGTVQRVIRLWAGPAGGAASSGQAAYWNSTTNSIYAEGELTGRIDVLSDGSANHRASPSSGGVSLLTVAGGYQTQQSTIITLTPLVDFSEPWEVAVVMQSAAETAVNIASATWAGGVATYNTSAEHTLAVGDKTTIAGVNPAGYNGTYIVDTVPDSDTFTVALAADPGTYTSGGTSSRVSNMVSQSYVLELVG